MRLPDGRGLVALCVRGRFGSCALWERVRVMDATTVDTAPGVDDCPEGYCEGCYYNAPPGVTRLVPVAHSTYVPDMRHEIYLCADCADEYVNGRA